MNRASFLLIPLVIFLLPACTNKNYLQKSKVYLNASTQEEKSRYMDTDFRSFFIEKKGNGEGRIEALKSFQNWDAPLHPDIEILHYSVTNRTWSAAINEQNDFTKLIGFPGWKASVEITFSDQGLIKEVFYVPDANNPSYKKWLLPAIDWLKKNRPDELNEVYQDNKLVENEATAAKWVILLQAWRDSK